MPKPSKVILILQFPWAFRWRVDLIGWGFVFLFITVLGPLLYVMDQAEERHRERQVLPVLSNSWQELDMGN